GLFRRRGSEETFDLFRRVAPGEPERTLVDHLLREVGDVPRAGHEEDACLGRNRCRRWLQPAADRWFPEQVRSGKSFGSGRQSRGQQAGEQQRPTHLSWWRSSRTAPRVPEQAPEARWVPR